MDGPEAAGAERPDPAEQPVRSGCRRPQRGHVTDAARTGRGRRTVPVRRRVAGHAVSRRGDPAARETGTLGEVRQVSSVSGGSITAGVLARAWPAGGSPDPQVVRRKLIDPLLDLSRKFVDIPAFVTGTLIPGSTPGQRFAQALAGHLYGGMALRDLPSTPEFVFNATNLGTGALWRFSREFVGDWLVGGGPREETRVADAVAASCAFPPFFAPFRLHFPSTAAWPESGRWAPPRTGSGSTWATAGSTTTSVSKRRGSPTARCW